jgi:glutamyl-tRNA synthetase
VIFRDLQHGSLSAVVDDFILLRRDGVPSYHLAVVVDDDAQAVTEIVRGDDLLLPTTARHAFLYDALSLARPAWRHVPLVLEGDGRRMAKRQGSNTREGYLAAGHTDTELLLALARSLDLEMAADPVTAGDLLNDFQAGGVPPDPVVLTAQPREASRSSQ